MQCPNCGYDIKNGNAIIIASELNSWQEVTEFTEDIKKLFLRRQRDRGEKQPMEGAGVK